MSDYDLSKLYIDFTQCPKNKRLREHFSEFSAFKEFDKAEDVKIKIAILIGDIDSPFVRIKDRETMVREVFSYLGINPKEESKFLEDIIFYKDATVTMCWLRYLQMLHETDFTDWQLARKDYDYFLQKSNEEKTPDENDDKYLARRNKIRETVKTLGQEVRSIEAKIFPDSKAAREAAIAESKSKIKLYAEMYAEQFGYI